MPVSCVTKDERDGRVCVFRNSPKPRKRGRILFHASYSEFFHDHIERRQQPIVKNKSGGGSSLSWSPESRPFQFQINKRDLLPGVVQYPPMRTQVKRIAKEEDSQQWVQIKYGGGAESLIKGKEGKGDEATLKQLGGARGRSFPEASVRPPILHSIIQEMFTPSN